MTIAKGVAKKLHYKKETTWGTKATGGAATGQVLRRLQSTLNLEKQTYRSNEIASHQQRADFRHGSRSVSGAISGELSVGTWKDFMASILRGSYGTAATTGALITVTAATTSGANGTFTRSAGSYLTDGFKVGDIVRWTGWTVATANNAKNMQITALTATVMTVVTIDGSAIVAKAAGDSVTCTLAGKKVFTPLTGQTDESYSFEHFYSDIDESEVYTGCKIGQMAVNCPATGMAEIEMQVLGKDREKQTGAHFTSPTAASSGNSLSAVNGALYIGGTKYVTVTGMNFTINGNMSGGEVIGSTSSPDIFLGAIDVSGQLTVYFEDVALRDMFDDETEATLSIVMTGDNTANASFVSFVMPRIKVGGSNKDDGEKGLIQTVPFTALLRTDGGAGTAHEATTISYQDSSVS